LVGENSHRPLANGIFGGFTRLARALNSKFIDPKANRRIEKGEFQMSSSYRTFIAMAAALLMSTVTVGAAVGPAQANANPIQVSQNA
jgi:hypothetical protein